MDSDKFAFSIQRGKTSRDSGKIKLQNRGKKNI